MTTAPMPIDPVFAAYIQTLSGISNAQDFEIFVREVSYHVQYFEQFIIASRLSGMQKAMVHAALFALYAHGEAELSQDAAITLLKEELAQQRLIAIHRAGGLQ